MRHQLRWAHAIALAFVAAGLFGCGGEPRQPAGEGGHYKPLRPYEIKGRRYEPIYDPAYRATGIASWYGDPFHGRLTANGERYDKRLLSAAHTTLPLPSFAEVTNLENGRTIQVRVNDRGPFVGDRIIDLSEAAAEVLGFKDQGLARVEVRFLGLAESSGTPPTPTPTVAKATAPPSGVAVAAAKPPDTVSRSTPPALCDGHFVEVGSFREPARAQAAALMLQGRFSSPVRGRTVEDNGVVRVRVGPFADVDAAYRALATVARDGYAEALVVQTQAPPGTCRERAA